VPPSEVLNGRTRPITISDASPSPPSQPRTAADDVLRALVRHWLLALLVAAGITILATLAASVQPKRYTAEAVGAVVLLPAAMSTSETLHGVDTLDRRVVIASIAALAETPAIRQQVHAASDDAVSSIVLPSTSLFRVSVEGRDPRRVVAIANAIPHALSPQARAMYAIYDVTTVSPATVPEKPSRPRMERAAFAGLLLGVFCGVVAAYLADRRVRAPAGR
jgi:uncharacterized protein involved in exopolysaccharide biosynthesis